MSDRDELIKLRVAVARIAQALGVTNQLQVLDLGYPDLVAKASSKERGWHDLAGTILGHLENTNAIIW